MSSKNIFKYQKKKTQLENFIYVCKPGFNLTRKWATTGLWSECLTPSTDLYCVHSIGDEGLSR
jgi:hypothetical protein